MTSSYTTKSVKRATLILLYTYHCKSIYHKTVQYNVVYLTSLSIFRIWTTLCSIGLTTARTCPPWLLHQFKGRMCVLRRKWRLLEIYLLRILRMSLSVPRSNRDVVEGNLFTKGECTIEHTILYSIKCLF